MKFQDYLHKTIDIAKIEKDILERLSTKYCMRSDSSMMNAIKALYLHARKSIRDDTKNIALKKYNNHKYIL